MTIGSNTTILNLDKFDITFAVITVLLMITLAFSPVKPKRFGDNNFHTETKNWVDIIQGEATWDDFYIEKAPGPDFYYLIPYFIVGNKAGENSYWLAGIIWNGIFMVISILLVRRMAFKLSGKNAGIFAGVLMLLFPIHLYYAMGINGESMAFFGLVLALYGAIGWTIDKGNKAGTFAWWWFTIGSLILLLARFNFVIVIPVILLFLAVSWKQQNRLKIQKGLLIYLLVLAVCAALTRFSLGRIPGNVGKNYSDNYGAYVLHLGRFQFREEPMDWRFWEGDLRGDSQDYQNWQKSRKELGKKIDLEKGILQSKVYNEWVINDYIAHPFMTIKQFLVKTIYGNIFIVNSFRANKFSFGPLKGKLGYYIFHLLVNMVNLFVVIGFIGFLWHQRKYLLSTYWYIPVLFLSFIGFYALTYMEPRYLFPIRVLYIITASVFWLPMINNLPWLKLSDK